MIEFTNKPWKWPGIVLCCFLVGLALGACSNDEGGGGPTPGVECDSDADCDDGYCDPDGECVDCVDDAHCDGDDRCDQGSCVGCIDDDDCAGDDVCRLGSCAECRNDDDCDEGFECRSGECTDTPLCEDVTCPAGQHCEESSGLCVDNPSDPGYNCVEPEDLGQLSDGESFSVSADPSDQPSTEDPTCSHADSGNAVFQFSVDEPMDIFIEFGEHDSDLIMEIRQGDCSDPGTAVDRFPSVGAGGCDNVYPNDPVDFDAEPGTTYYIIVEARHDAVTQPFDFSVETEALACAPKGLWSCDADDAQGVTINQCILGTHEEPETCGVGCENDECLGDGCHNAIEVTGSITVEGTTRPYTNSFDFRPHPECSSDIMGSEGPISDGRDMVFFLPGLVEGQTVIADGSTTAQTNYFAIVENCDEQNLECLHGESHGQVMEWTVVDDGDFYLIFNRDSSHSGEFTYMIDIVD